MATPVDSATFQIGSYSGSSNGVPSGRGSMRTLTALVLLVASTAHADYAQLVDSFYAEVPKAVYVEFSVPQQELPSIRSHMGAGTLRYSAEGYMKRWRTRFERRSPVNTTDWDRLPVAKAS